ncbi:MAG: saccharopine dehydrogenase NADP-binding domain-containing protein [Deltaproteobacteria bacterium]|nr:saccharopine dehydrogenase NADP-binding domain-containing protein [Deltaproteobacteria bacterium]
MSDDKFLIYGAYGYSGELIARLAVERGHRPVLGGRDPEKLGRLAQELGLEKRVFKLEDPRIIEGELAPFRAVLHCAGPFLHTYGKMSRACLATQTHYLDISGEASVFESLAARHQEATEAGIFILPGVGFDVVPTDCLALHLKERLPSATHLALGLKAMSRISRGTARTMAENLHRGGLVRQEGKLTPVPAAWKSRTIEFQAGRQSISVTIPWGDVATAFHSTGIPNIEVYAAMPSSSRFYLKLSRYLAPLLATAPVRAFVAGRAKGRPAGPNEQQRKQGKSLLWGEARDSNGQTVTSRLETPEGYTLTARTAVAILERVLSGEERVGFLTPAMAFGSDFISGIEGVGPFLDEE